MQRIAPHPRMNHPFTLPSQSAHEILLHLVQLPPASPYAPSASLPYLAGQLRAFGVHARIVSLNVSFAASLAGQELAATLRRSIRTAQDVGILAEAEHAIDNALHAVLPPIAGSVNSWAQLIDSARSYSAFVVQEIAADILLALTSDSCRIVGFTCANLTETALAIRVSNALRAARASIVTILGGPFLSNAASRFHDEPPVAAVNYFVAYGGAATLFSLLQHINGLAGLPEGVVCDANRHAAVPGRDVGLFNAALARPVYVISEVGKYLAPRPVLPIFSAQGCAYGRCTFCSSNSAITPYRYLPLAEVYGAMHECRQSLGVADFDIVDNNFDASKLRAMASIARNGRVRWKATARFDRRLTSDLFIAVRNAGCTLLSLGLESASDPLLRTMKKGFRAQTAAKVLEAAQVAGLPIHLYVILGYPGETAQDRLKTIAFLRGHRAAFVSVYFQFYDTNLSSGVFTAGKSFQPTTLRPAAAWMEAIRVLSEESGVNAYWSDTGILFRPTGYPLNDELFLIALSPESDR